MNLPYPEIPPLRDCGEVVVCLIEPGADGSLLEVDVVNGSLLESLNHHKLGTLYRSLDIASPIHEGIVRLHHGLNVISMNEFPPH